MGVFVSSFIATTANLPPEDSVILIDWESLLAERKERKQGPGRPVAGARKKQQKVK